MGRFASTVRFYEEAREPYGAVFFEKVANVLGLRGRERLLDLGTGPGLLAIGFARHVGEVVGVDPEPAMIEAARRAAERSDATLRLIEGRAEALPSDIGTFDIVTIGRALHWMEPAATREALDRIVRPRGLVLVCRAGSVADGRNPWLAAYDGARAGWTETTGTDRHIKEPDVFFAGTRFRRADAISVETEHTFPVERLVERVLSKSSSSSRLLRGRIEKMREAVFEALSPFTSDGLIAEVVEARAEVFGSDSKTES